MRALRTAAFILFLMRAAHGGDGSSSVTWQGNKATIGFTEPLADAKAAKGERPFSVITGPYISWLTESSARISWEVIAEKSILDKSPYFVSEKTTYPFETNLAIRSAEFTGLKPDSEYQYCLAFLKSLFITTGTGSTASVDLDQPGTDVKTKTPNLEGVKVLGGKGLIGSPRLASAGTPLALGDKLAFATRDGEVAVTERARRIAAEHMGEEPNRVLKLDQEREIAEIVREAAADFGVQDPAPWFSA